MNSKRPDNSTSLEARFRLSLDRFTSVDSLPTRLLIALSGGVDSVVLLSIAAKWQRRTGSAVRAIYVDHGLQSQSSQWGSQCAALCESLAVDFEVAEVSVDLDSGFSPEAAARDARYGALQASLEHGEILCTAHHADDQAETLLLQLFRGAGLHGLASMPESREFGRGFLLRPLLSASRGEILSFAKENKLSWCEDPSNSDSRYDRNFLRNDVLPLIESRWPQVRGSTSRSAAIFGEAMELANDIAKLDLRNTGTNATIAISVLASLSSVRQNNALRYWIGQNGFLAPSRVQLRQLVTDLIESDGDSGRVNFGTAQVALHQDQLFIGARGTFDPLPDFEYQWTDSSVPLDITELDWVLDAAERLRLAPYRGRRLTVRNRRGGERWRQPNADHSVTVKSLLQQRRVPLWQRSRLAFVFFGDELIDVCAPQFEL